MPLPTQPTLPPYEQVQVPHPAPDPTPKLFSKFYRVIYHIIMVENKQVRPLAPAAGSGAAGDGGGARTTGSSLSWSSSSRKLTKRRRMVMCLGCCGGSIIIVGVLILVLALTVFKVKDPIIAVNSVKLERFSFNSSRRSGGGGGGLLSGGDVAVNLTLSAGISIKNPNAASFKFGNSTTSVSYRGKTVAQVHGPAGKAGARKTIRLNVTVDVLADQLTTSTAGGDLTLLLLSDLASGTLTVDSHTNVGGRFSLLRIIKRHVDIVVNCTILVSVSNQNIQNLSCVRKVKM
ncbi:hypothetical protein ACLOJK_010055 [Asimina triloba]